MTLSCRELQVLRILGQPAGIEMPGREIGHRLAELDGFWWRLVTPSVYPLLYALEERGLISSRPAAAAVWPGGPRRRHYRITEAGRALLRIEIARHL